MDLSTRGETACSDGAYPSLHWGCSRPNCFRAMSILACLATAWFVESIPLVESALAECRAAYRSGLSRDGIDPKEVDNLCSALEPVADAGGSNEAPKNSANDDGGAFASEVLIPAVGNDGTWKKYVDEGNYLLQNKGDVGSGFILIAERSKPKWRSFGATVRFTHEPVRSGIVGAALVYENTDTDGLTIYTFQTDGTASSARNSGGDFTLLSTRRDSSLAVADRGLVDLLVEARAGKTELLVNGKPTGVSVPCAEASLGKVGLAVFGVGSFEFRSFTQEGS
jgi:hypothetical protein